MIKRIGFDIDGVLQEYQDYVINKVLEDYFRLTGKKYAGRIDYMQYDVRNAFPDMESSLKNSIIDGAFTDYMKNAPFEAGVRELFLYLKSKGMEIHIVTARHPDMNSMESLDEIIQLTEKRFLLEDIPVDAFHIGFTDKVSVILGSGIECMVEDSPENILSLSELIPCFVYTRCYNKLIRGSNIYRFETFYPQDFYRKLCYISEHRNYLGCKPQYQDKKAIDVSFVGQRCYINNLKATEGGPIFIVPLSGKREESLLNKWVNYCGGQEARLFNLYDMDSPVEKIKDPVIASIVERVNKNKIDISHTTNMPSDVYQIRSKIMTQILKYAKDLRNKRAIIFGPQIMSLERKILQELRNEFFILPYIPDTAKKIIVDSIYKKDYDIALLFEDLDEVSMDSRKFKIIAGTDPNHLKGYRNREKFVDGIDTVSFVDGERAYKPENLQAALSMNTYLLGDCHLTEKDKEKTEMILEHINMCVGRSDTLLFLGDFDGKFGASKSLIQKFVSRINCKNLYMIVGNNDGYTIDDYVQMGFKAISDIAYFQTENERIVLSHCPVVVTGQDINIHGHLHGGRMYWNMDAHNHFDIYDEDFIPVTIRDSLTILRVGYYRAVSVNVRPF